MLVRLFEMHNLQTQVLAKMVLCQWLHNLFFTDFTASKTEVEQHLKSVYSRTEAEQRGGSTASDEETHGSRVCV